MSTPLLMLFVAAVAVTTVGSSGVGAPGDIVRPDPAQMAELKNVLAATKAAAKLDGVQSAVFASVMTVFSALSSIAASGTGDVKDDTLSVLINAAASSEAFRPHNDAKLKHGSSQISNYLVSQCRLKEATDLIQTW